MHGNGFTDGRECTLQDWENLKAAYADAVESLEGDDLTRGIHLLRAVKRECTRFLSQHRDPAVLFTTPTATKRSHSPGTLTPTDERLSRDWDNDLMEIESDESTHHHVHRISPSHSGVHEHLSGALRIRGERPTAFHSIYGCTLFLFGHLLANVPSVNLTEEGECKDPMSYFLAAIEVFEQAESLPIMTSRSDAATRSTFADRNRAHLEDWLMAIAWGRTLVGLAKGASPSSSGARYPPQSSRYPSSSLQSPRSSIILPLNLHASTPAPHTQSTLDAHALLMQAQDHFMRGIFHMPHSVPRYTSYPLRDASERPPDGSSRRRSGSGTQQPGLTRFPPLERPQTRASTRVMTHGPDPSLSASASSASFSRPMLQVNLGSPPSSSSQPKLERLPRLNRSKTLFTIGTEVLKVAERLLPSSPPSSSHSNSSAMSPAHSRVMRQRERDCIEWAEYADGVLLQLESELKDHQSAKYATINPGMVSAARSRCAQIIGRALLATNRDGSMDSKARGTSARGVQNDEASYYTRKALEHFELALNLISCSKSDLISLIDRSLEYLIPVFFHAIFPR